MTSDYQSGARAMREMAAKIADKGSIRYRNGPNSPKGFDVLNRGRTNGSEETAGEIAEAIRALPLPADPASSEGAAMVVAGTPKQFMEARDATIKARDAEITIARCNLMLLEECCRYSLGLAEDLIGDALTKAVGDKVIAMRDEAATLRAALEKIADTSNWSTDQKVQIAVDALANLKAPTP